MANNALIATLNSRYGFGGKNATTTIMTLPTNQHTRNQKATLHSRFHTAAFHSTLALDGVKLPMNTRKSSRETSCQLREIMQINNMWGADHYGYMYHFFVL